MPINSVPDLLNFGRFNRRTASIKLALDQTSAEVVTGRRSDITKAANGDVGGAHLINKALQDIDAKKNIYQLTKTRMNLMGTTLTGARKTLDGLGTKSITVVASNSDTGVTTLIQDAEAKLRSVFSSLQINQGNRNLFSGDATNVQPLTNVDQLLNDVKAIVAAGPDQAAINTALDTYFNDPAGGFQQDIYQGGSGNANTVLLKNDTRVDFTIRADDPAIKQTLRGLATLAATDSLAADRFSDDFKSYVDEAAFHLNNGESGLVELESKLGVGQQLISSAEEILASEKFTLTTTYDNIVGRDQFEASTALKALETQLETSYILTARLSQLRLTNFLR